MTTVVKRIMLLPLLAAAYFWLVDKAVSDPGFDLPYSQFALQSASLQAGKLIIDGGAGAHSAYSASALESTLQRVTVISADSDIIPLQQRLRRLSPALKPGDTVVLPLAWHSYLPQAIGDTYISHAMLGDYRYFYRSLPLAQRLAFVFTQLPLKQAWSLLRADTREPTDNVNAYVSELAGRIYTRSPVIADRNPVPATATEQAQCPAADALDLAHIDSSLQLVGELMAMRQATLIFASPPGVAGTSPCTQRQRQQLGSALQNALAAYGIAFVKTPLLPANCAAKQSARVHPACAQRASEELSKVLTPILDSSTATDSSELRQRLQLQRLKQLQIAHTHTTLPFDVRVEGKDLIPYVAFLKGWYGTEPWGRWSSGYESSFSIPLSERPGKILIEGHYADGNEKTAIWINNQYIGEHVIQSTLFDLSTVLLNDQLLEIRLGHKNPRQPSKEKPNTRAINYGLMRIELRY